MKNKKLKKIMVGAFLGTMMCATSFLAVGCTEVPLTQEQTDKIIDVVENADKFMAETNEQMTDVNVNIDEMNSLLEKIQLSLSIDKQSVYNLFVYSHNSILVNKDNMWDNLKISMTSKFNEIDEMLPATSNTLILFKSDEERYAVYNYNPDGSESIYYELGSDYNTTSESYSYKLFECLNNSFSLFDELSSLTYEKLVNIEMSENGNYILRFSYGDLESEHKKLNVSNVEITANGQLVGIHQWDYGHYYGGSDEYKYATNDVCYSFIYNEVTEEEVSSLITSANAQKGIFAN